MNEYRHIWRLPLTGQDDLVTCVTDNGAVDVTRYNDSDPNQTSSMTTLMLDTPQQVATAHRLLDIALWHLDPTGQYRTNYKGAA